MKTRLLRTTLALAACISTTLAQTVLFEDDFGDPNLTAWELPPNSSTVDQQFVLSGDFGPMNPDNYLAAWTGAGRSIPTSGPLPDHQTLEFRADLVDANQADALASVHYFNGVDKGYIFGKSQNVLTCFKFWNGAQNNSGAVFFYDHSQLKNQNVTLTLALTRLGSDLTITTRILDKDNANAVLFERTVTDTPQADPVLPNRAPDGMLCYPDPAGTPWPVLSSSGSMVLSLTWLNPTQAPQPTAQVVFDNAEAWQYESPELTIQNAIVLSWPVTTGQFVLESASSVDGPWQPIVEPWSRTKEGQVQVCILAPDSSKFFRLRLGP
ncbi:MAG TPA: hypothetical protein PKM73_11800 [Verrucomicrobiota bacterium]|nr:hypothetical protein [Verrucomicrobiota bacterium]